MSIMISDSFDVNMTDYVLSESNVLIIRRFLNHHQCNHIINEATCLQIDKVSTPQWHLDNFVSTWQDDSKLAYYRLADPESLGSPHIAECYRKMKDCIHSIRERNSQVIIDDTGHRYHLELLHYREHDYFGKHTHEYQPQLVGLILLLSGINIDYEAGGTVFYGTDGIIDINDHAGKGDLIIFRYDMPHEVTKVVGKQGRWVAVLPYY